MHPVSGYLGEVLVSKVWEFHRRQRKMPLTTSIFQNVLQASGFSEAERLAREAIQNSADAHLKKCELPVSVCFEKRSLTGESKKELVTALALDEEPASREDLFDLPEGNALSQAHDPDAPLPVLIISDHNTHGLTGRWDGTGADDHFGRLVVNLGIDDKADSTEISGGSFGFGKTVYGKSSGIGVVAFYSAFEPTKATDGASARFMATGFFSQHEHQGEDYDGFAFFGLPDPDHDGEALPFTDDQAHTLAAACGLEPRDVDTAGTTILIVDCDLDMQDLKLAAEIYWWPRLIRQDLDLVLIDEGEELFPRPKSNDEIRPFIDCYQNYVSDYNDPPTATLKRFNSLNIEDQYKGMGHISCVLLEDDSKLKNKVALTRGPGMVVEYLPAGTDSFEPCAGVYVSDPDIEKYLTYSEPQMHDKWDPQADRLKKKFPHYGPKVVESTLQRVVRHFRDFQKSQEPPVPPGGPQPKELANLLGRFMSMPGKRPDQGPDKPTRPISLHVEERRTEHQGSIWDQAVIEIELREEYEKESVNCRLSAHHEVLADASHRVLTRSLCRLFDAGETELGSKDQNGIDIALEKGQRVRLIAKAETERESLARIRVAVEENEPEEIEDV